MKLSDAQRAYLRRQAADCRELRARQYALVTASIERYERLAGKSTLSAGDIEWIVSRFGLVHLAEAERLGFTTVDRKAQRQQLLEGAVELRNLHSAEIAALLGAGNKSSGNVTPLTRAGLTRAPQSGRT